MAFSNARLDTIGDIGIGNLVQGEGVITTYTTFENGLEAGKFCFYDDVNDKVQKTVTSVVAGVVKRNVAGALEDGGTFTSDNASTVDVLEAGLITVSVKPSAGIKKFGTVYVDKLTGQATDDSSTANSIEVDGVFYKKVNDSVWVIRLK